MHRLAAFLCVLFIVGCSSAPKAPLPIAKTACLTLVGLNETEREYVTPLVRERLQAYHDIQMVSQGCDLTIRYSRLAMVNDTTRTALSLGFSKKPALGEDGLVHLTPAGGQQGEPVPISSRGNDTAADSLNWLATEIVRATTARYRAK